MQCQCQWYDVGDSDGGARVQLHRCTTTRPRGITAEERGWCGGGALALRRAHLFATTSACHSRARCRYGNIGVRPPSELDWPRPPGLFHSRESPGTATNRHEGREAEQSVPKNFRPEIQEWQRVLENESLRSVIAVNSIVKRNVHVTVASRGEHVLRIVCSSCRVFFFFFFFFTR